VPLDHKVLKEDKARKGRLVHKVP